MANRKVVDLPELTMLSNDDELYIVDVSDLTESSEGTSKKIKASNFVPAGGELIANKQNSLTSDGTGVKYPTVDAVNNALDLKENLFDKTLYTNAYINNGRLVCNDVNSTTTAHYLGLELDTSIPQWLKAGVIWETGTTGALIAIISNQNGNKKLADITSKSLHITFTDTKFEVGYFNAGVLTVTHVYTYPVACLRDNSTEYTFGWRATDTQLIIYAGAYTQTYNYSTDGIDYRTYCGKYAIYEHYYTGTGKARPQFNWIETRNNTPVVMIDNFNRPNGAPMQNGFGYVYSQFTNLTSGGNSVVDLYGKSLTLTTAPTTSAGTYDILTRNTSTGVVEKVLSNTIATVASPSFTGTPTAPTATAGTNTTQIATTAFVQAAKTYKVYTALVSQSGTSAPTATVLENTLGGTVVWTRASIGNYHGTLTGAFVTNKTTIQITGNFSNVIASAYRSTSDLVVFMTSSSGALSDTGITNGTIEIRVYN